MFKNVAFCLCISMEQQEISLSYSVKYKIIPDNSINGYTEYIMLELELFTRNKSLNKFVE